MSAPIERTYAGYRLLDLTTSLKADKDECHKAHIKTDDNGDTTGEDAHTDACYNYAYTVNPKYRDILKEAVAEATLDDAMDDDVFMMTDEQVIEYINSLSSDEKDDTGKITDMGTVREYIEEVYKKIVAVTPQMEPEEKNHTGIFADIAQGYWMFVDSTNLDGEYESHSLLIVDTKGQTDLTVTPKTSVPTVEKKVWQNDTADSEDLKNKWGDYADWNIGDDVPFQLTGTIAEYYEYYETYEYIFHDDLSEGLLFNQDSVKVYIDGQEIKETDYKVLAEMSLTDVDFEIAFDDLKLITENKAGDDLKVTKDSIIVVEYTAKLTSDAVIGNDGNLNTVYLEFSNNPNGEGTGHTPEDKVVVFTFELDGTKVDAENPEEELADAWFVLYREEKGEVQDPNFPDNPDKKIIETVPVYAEIENGIVTGWSETKPTHKDAKGNDVAGNIQSDDKGIFKVIGLDQNTYYLEETVAPAGFNLLKDPIRLDIEATYTAEPDSVSGLHKVEKLTIRLNVEVDDNGDPVVSDGNVDTGIVEITVENSTGVELPSTGGMGTTIFYVIGSILVAGTAILFITRKRMSIDSEN